MDITPYWNALIVMVSYILRSALHSQGFCVVPLRSDPEKFDVNSLSFKDLGRNGSEDHRIHKKNHGDFDVGLTLNAKV